MVRKHRLHTALAQMALWLLTVASVSYFAHHAVHGNRGIVAKRASEAEIEALHQRLAVLKEERLGIQKRVDALTPPAIDRDLLDQIARERLGYMHPDERILQIR